MIRGLLRTILIGAAIAVAGVRALFSPSAHARPAPRSRWSGVWKRRLFEYAALFAVLGVIGFLGAASGVIPIRASSGHWAITRWLLQFSMARSVSMHALGIQPPPLDDRALVIKGAGAYDLGCRPCHGSPDLPNPRIARGMLPQPRYLPPEIQEWTAPQLFYIVKHGVKFTGMPAWPSQNRDDEVWAVVAFLRQFPKLDAAAYERLVYGEPATGPMPNVPLSIVATCAPCHGLDGRGRAGAFPRLAGQRATYLFNALQAFARGRRHSGLMEPLAAGLSVAEMRQVALYFSSAALSAAPARRTTDQAFERGMSIAARGLPAQNVPPCSHCHGPAPSRKNEAYPILAGQSAGYLVLQLELFSAERRGGSPYAHLMRPVAAGLTPQQMRDVALYYESLGAP